MPRSSIGTGHPITASGAFLLFGLFIFLFAAFSVAGQDSQSVTGGVGAVADDLPVTIPADAFGTINRGVYLVELPANVSRGGILPVVVAGAEIAAVQGEIVLGDGRVLESHGWRVAAKSALGGEAWQFLVGIPSTADIGPARVRIAVQSVGSEESNVLRRTIEITPRSFVSETIPLSGSMTTLRADPDPRKTEESRVLWALLNSTDLSARYHSGHFAMPLDSFRYTSFYGDRRTYAYSDGNTAGAIHNGLDLAAPTGTPVSSPARGRVVMAINRIVTGWTIVLEHLPAVYSLYYHLDSVSVARGDIVKTGQLLGYVGSTGLSTGPHLHWEMRVSGVAVDPGAMVTETHLDIDRVRSTLSQVP